MIRQAVALAIRRPSDPAALLIVQRPPDDADLPNVWGLPAATLAPGESWHDAARRAGRDKLGVELNVGPVLNEGSLERDAYTLEMRVYEATITAGAPAVPRHVQGVTQYQDWRWGNDRDLEVAAQKGSLCSRLYLAR